MPRDAKLKTIKRKTEAPPAPTANKAKKVDPAKDLKKSTNNDLNLQFKILQQENIELLEENKLQREKISMLERKLEIGDNPEKTSISVQTEDMHRMFCVECEYPAEDLFDLGEHMYEFHVELNDEYTIACHHCGNHFKSKHDLMIHRKKAHEERVGQCSFFLEGTCTFGDECWYSHKINSRKRLTEYKCNICEKIFKLKSEFMKHRRNEHIESVPLCRDEKNGTCHFGKLKCWFIHEDVENLNENGMLENGNNVNQEVVDKIFNMMENFTQRILDIENNL